MEAQGPLTLGNDPGLFKLFKCLIRTALDFWSSSSKGDYWACSAVKSPGDTGDASVSTSCISSLQLKARPWWGDVMGLAEWKKGLLPFSRGSVPASSTMAPANETLLSRESTLRQLPPQAAYPVEHICPALHGDALKHSEHGKGKIVKVGDAAIGANPATPTLRSIGGALASIPWERTRHWVLFSHHICKQRRQASPLRAVTTLRNPCRGSREFTPLSSVLTLRAPFLSLYRPTVFSKILHFTYLAVPGLRVAHGI